MVVSRDSVWDALIDSVERVYDNAIVYGDMEGDTVLHEGPVRIMGNGWVELPDDRLISPEAVHHVDVKPTE